MMCTTARVLPRKKVRGLQKRRQGQMGHSTRVRLPPQKNFGRLHSDPSVPALQAGRWRTPHPLAKREAEGQDDGAKQQDKSMKVTTPQKIFRGSGASTTQNSLKQGRTDPSPGQGLPRGQKPQMKRRWRRGSAEVPPWGTDCSVTPHPGVPFFVWSSVFFAGVSGRPLREGRRCPRWSGVRGVKSTVKNGQQLLTRGHS